MSKIVLVTGASSGLGRATVELLARAGHTVWAGMRDVGSRNAAVAAELGALAEREDLRLRVVELDVTRADSVAAAVARVLAADARVDVLFNNAGRMFAGLAESFSAEQLQLQLDTNLVGPFRLVKAVLPAMRAQGSGLLLHTSSVFGRITSPFSGLYAAAKFGLEALMQSIAYETHLLGIDSVLIEAGPFNTNITESGVTPADADVIAAYGPIAQAMQGWLGGFGAFLSQPDPVLDPLQVARAVEALIAMPAGTRPSRQVVGLDYGVTTFNEAAEPIERSFLESQQLGFLIGPRSAS